MTLDESVQEAVGLTIAVNRAARERCPNLPREAVTALTQVAAILHATKTLEAALIDLGAVQDEASAKLVEKIHTASMYT